ncbi:ATP-binding protein [uncultured Desulfobulbus sp.]|uniref:ATP-binding protein n=1 Tax=uncultured Desulfobulbus sp. TaxID=239745 RepID=UPI0029C67237|nr:ATP-binding protein [uncultured Desulfobulbus sp.]
MPNDQLSKIRRIRLINFHNFINETIEINHGGHLFLLGDNGSGKTTLLDAIHLVLTANEDVEFNAAARVVGNLREGRRLQGIILRHNMDAAFDSCGITYAALEIEGWQGKPICLVLGMETHTTDEQIRYWGVVRTCKLEDLPLLVEIPGGTAPATRRELKEQLSGNGFCPDLKSYRNELIRRLYGDENLFKETCRLLRMGKAYREIAAGTSDYHELFKKLLPDPQQDLFERVIRTLRELDQSKNDLAGLEDKQNYLKALADTVTQIDHLRESALRYTWLIHYLTIQNQSQQIAACEEEKTRHESELKDLRVQIEREINICDDYRRQLDALQKADASGLLTLHKERSAELSRLSIELSRQKDNLKMNEKHQSEMETRYQHEFQRWQTLITQFYNALHKLRQNLPFAISELLAEIDSMQRETSARELCDGIIESLTLNTQQHLTDLAIEQSGIQNQRTNLQDEIKAIESEIIRLKDSGEVMPRIPGFTEACRTIERNMIEFSPLYRQLEWKPGISANMRSMIEEVIGSEILSTILISSADYDTAAEHIFASYPGIRLARREDAREDAPAWIRESFDIAESDPAAIRILAAEMYAAADTHPATRSLNDALVMRFRSHEYKLQGDPAILIGAQRRQEALRREVKRLSEQQKELESRLRDLDKTQNALKIKQDALYSLSQELRNAQLNIKDARYKVSEAQAQKSNAEIRVNEQRSALDETIRVEGNCREVINVLEQRINNEGLDKLEEKQHRVSREIERSNQQITSLRQKEGALCQRLLDSSHQIEFIGMQIRLEEEQLGIFDAQLQPFAGGVESVTYYVLRTWRGQQFDNIENVHAELEKVQREEYGQIGSLKERLNHPTYGAVYSFTYEERVNRLVDRHMSLIADVVEAGRQLIDEQREVINERTTELIRNIIMGDLFMEMKRGVRTLRDMVKKINYLLKGRVFGSNRYHFRLEEEKRYRELLSVIERLNPLDPAAQEELQHFLESCKSEIMATEVNEIPEPLDYRNWFHYELAMDVEGSEVIINRRTKSLGSGGEQAVPNYLLILTVAYFHYDRNDSLRIRAMLFDEAFYGIDANRRDQLLGFASDLGLQLFIASPDLDGVKQEIPSSTTLLVVKDEECNIHLFACDFTNPTQLTLLEGVPDLAAAEFNTELGTVDV